MDIDKYKKLVLDTNTPNEQIKRIHYFLDIETKREIAVQLGTIQFTLESVLENLANLPTNMDKFKQDLTELRKTKQKEQ